MKRLVNWPRLLAAYLESSHARAFQWGAFDCAMNLCDGIQAITGVDVGAPYRGTYSTPAQASAMVAAAGDLGKFAASVAAVHGFAEWVDKKTNAPTPAFARRGDAVYLHATDPSGALGIVDLTGRYAWCASDKGFLRVPIGRWLRAWKIG